MNVTIAGSILEAVEARKGMMPRVLVVSSDVIGPRMAGSGMRSWEIAKALALHQPVVVATPGTWAPPDREPLPTNLQVSPYRWGNDDDLVPLVKEADVLVGQGVVLGRHPSLMTSAKPLAVDLATPLLLEGLELYSAGDPQTSAQLRAYVDITNGQLLRGDFFFCASERQRDYWLGALGTCGRINGTIYAGDATLHNLIDSIPFGLQSSAPRSRRTRFPQLRGAIGDDDIVLLWNGGLWPWLDPLIVIRAVAALAAEYRTLKLVLLAGPRPNPEGAPFRTAVYDQAHALTAELGIGGQVLFVEEWVPYAERDLQLAAADVGVCAHHAHIEARYAFRTRLVDCLWAGLPIITSQGDSLAALVEANAWGSTVAPDDLDGWVVAIRRMVEQPGLRMATRQRLLSSAPNYTWERVVEPLQRFCLDPRRTAGREHGAMEPRLFAAPQRENVAELQHELERRGAAYAELEAYARRLEGLLEQGQSGGVRGLLRRFKDGRS